MKILSLFDGMSCGRIALERLGVFVSKYYACEIDKYAIQVSKDNYPNIIQLGDVVRLRKSLEMNLATLRHLAASDNYYTQIIDIKTNGIDMIIGGSPCQGFSFAGKQLRFDDERSVLFFEFVKIKELLNPRFWFLENVRMDKRSEAVISKFMGKRPYKFNSALVSAQNRLRLYWTNISIKSIPIDKGILLKDILQDEKEVGSEFYLSEKAIDFITKPMRLKKRFTALNGDKAICLTAKGNSNWTGTFIELPQSLVETRSEEGKIIRKENRRSGRDYNPFRAKEMTLRFDGKSNCLTATHPIKENVICLNLRKTDGSQTYQQDRIYSENGKSVAICAGLSALAIQTKTVFRRLTPVECERLQTVPDGYTKSVSKSQAYKMLGNGWTVDMICFFFNRLKTKI